MFTWLNKQGVQSDKGFVAQRTGRFTSEYREGSRKISISLDNGVLPNGKFCEIINAHEFSKWDDGESIPKKKRDEIIKNYVEALEFQDVGVVVD